MTAPLEAMQNLSESTSEPAKAQQEPHWAWLRISWMQAGHWLRESKESGRVTSLRKDL